MAARQAFAAHPAPGGLARHPAPASEAADGGLPLAMRLCHLLAIAAVLGALTFNTFLCFVNTRVMGTADRHVMLAELAILGCAFIGAATRKSGLYVFIAVFLSYMILLFMLRGGAMNPKPVRDILIPLAFYFMGRRIADLKLCDRLVLASAVIVVAFGLFEYLFLETFLDYFNVIGYYLARGSVTLDQTFGQTRGLFISGQRPEARTILPFLGQHRVSSVFLEPVSMGNFAVIVYCWALFRGRAFKGRFVAFLLAFAVVALADARFGLYSCVLITLLYPFYRFLPRLSWSVLPFLMLSVLAIYGVTSVEGGGPNDLAGRVAVTADILTSLSLGVVLGIETTTRFVSDSGLAYSLVAFGIGGFVALWSLFVHAPVAHARAWRYHSMMILYVLLLMMISDSFYSIKTAALMWFILGSSNAYDYGRDEAEASAAQRQAVGRPRGQPAA